MKYLKVKSSLKFIFQVMSLGSLDYLCVSSNRAILFLAKYIFIAWFKNKKENYLQCHDFFSWEFRIHWRVTWKSYILGKSHTCMKAQVTNITNVKHYETLSFQHFSSNELLLFLKKVETNFNGWKSRKLDSKESSRSISET